MNLKSYFIILVFVMFAIVPVYAQNTLLTCQDNSILLLNISFNTTVTSGNDTNSTFTTQAFSIECPYGCDNSTGGIDDCNPDPTEPGLFVIVPPIILFFLASLLLWKAINLKEYVQLQFLFLGFALFFMIVMAWYGQSEAFNVVSNDVGEVLLIVYQAMITLFSLVIIYFILVFLRKTWIETGKKRRGEDL